MSKKSVLSHHREMKRERTFQEMQVEWPKILERLLKVEQKLERHESGLVTLAQRIARIDYRYLTGKVRLWRDRRRNAKLVAKREEEARQVIARREAEQRRQESPHHVATTGS